MKRESIIKKMLKRGLNLKHELIAFRIIFRKLFHNKNIQNFGFDDVFTSNSSMVDYNLLSCEGQKFGRPNTIRK